MAKKEQIPGTPISDLSGNTPFREEISVLSSRLISESSQSLASGDIDTIEASGKTALAIMWEKIKKGELPLKEEASFLRSLATTKTPAPVVKVEQKQQLDMRMLIADAIEANPEKFTASVQRAAERRLEVIDRLKIDQVTMMLPDVEEIEENVIEERVFTPDQSFRRDMTEEYKWKPGMDPEEIAKLRAEQRRGG